MILIIMTQSFNDVINHDVIDFFWWFFFLETAICFRWLDFFFFFWWNFLARVNPDLGLAGVWRKEMDLHSMLTRRRKKEKKEKEICFFSEPEEKSQKKKKKNKNKIKN